DLEGIVVEFLLEHERARTFFVEQMARGYNKTLDILRPHQVQLVWPRTVRVDFVFADGPLVHWSADGRLTALGGLALGDADQVYFPLGRRLGALFTSRRFADTALSDDEVQWLNRKSWNAALRWVGAHPDTNAKRSLLVWDLRNLDSV